MDFTITISTEVCSMTYEEFESTIRKDNFRSVSFTLNGVECGLSAGWLAWGGFDRTYSTKEEMLSIELPRVCRDFKYISDIEFTMD